MTTTVATIFEILKYVIPALIVLVAVNMTVRRFLDSQFRQKQLTMLSGTQETTIRLRLQAYERLALYIERIHPRQLIPRIYQQGMTTTDLQQALIYAINDEFEHNLAQQIYVTRQVGPGRELHTKIVEYVLTTEGEMPTEIALGLINEEAKRILSYGAHA